MARSRKKPATSKKAANKENVQLTGEEVELRTRKTPDFDIVLPRAVNPNSRTKKPRVKKRNNEEVIEEPTSGPAACNSINQEPEGKPEIATASGANEEENKGQSQAAGKELFCICQTPNDKKKPMIACECSCGCEEWIHYKCSNRLERNGHKYKCVWLTSKTTRKIKHYYCPRCQTLHDVEIEYYKKYQDEVEKYYEQMETVQVKQEPMDEEEYEQFQTSLSLAVEQPHTSTDDGDVIILNSPPRTPSPSTSAAPPNNKNKRKRKAPAPRAVSNKKNTRKTGRVSKDIVNNDSEEAEIMRILKAAKETVNETVQNTTVTASDPLPMHDVIYTPTTSTRHNSEPLMTPEPSEGHKTAGSAMVPESMLSPSTTVSSSESSHSNGTDTLMNPAQCLEALSSQCFQATPAKARRGRQPVIAATVQETPETMLSPALMLQALQSLYPSLPSVSNAAIQLQVVQQAQQQLMELEQRLEQLSASALTWQNLAMANYLIAMTLKSYHPEDDTAKECIICRLPCSSKNLLLHLAHCSHSHQAILSATSIVNITRREDTRVPTEVCGNPLTSSFSQGVAGLILEGVCNYPAGKCPLHQTLWYQNTHDHYVKQFKELVGQYNLIKDQQALWKQLGENAAVSLVAPMNPLSQLLLQPGQNRIP